MANDLEIFLKSEEAKKNSLSGFVGSSKVQQAATTPTTPTASEVVINKSTEDGSNNIAPIPSSLLEPIVVDSPKPSAVGPALDANGNPVSKPQTTGQQKVADNPEVKKATPVVRKDAVIAPLTIKELELKTNLTLYPYLFGGELARIKHQFSDMNVNKYYLLLCLLVYGFDNKTLSSISPGQEKYVIDQGFINDFYKMAKQPLLQEALKKTPAWSKGCFTEVGKLGVTEVNGSNMSNNPITGPERNCPSLVEKLLNTIHPDAVENLEKFCNVIRTRSYLSLPKGSNSSIARLIAGINGAMEAFQTAINDVYNGIIYYVQQVYAFVNSQLAEAQKWLLSEFNKIIPLDLLCLILDTIQCVLDDVNFFTSLFNMSGPMMDYLNVTQNFVNSTSNFVSNPFTTLKAYLPPEVLKIVDMVDQIGNDPGGYLSDNLSNFGCAYVATALQGNLVGALVDKFGPQYGSITPLGNILTKSSAVYDRYGKGATLFPSTAASMGPNVYNGGKEDIYGNPISPGDIFANLKEDFKVLGEQTKEATAASSDITSGVSKFFGNVKTSVGKVFNGNKPEVQAEED
jgi:hypothetical protein